jgi:DNA polymerase III subunit gamma/tau
MAYLSLYRKYRSQTFGDLVGQDHVVKTLQNAIESGRISHAYLFTGPRGTGKTSSARLLAKALNAENGPTPTPSDDDPLCQMIAAGSCPDVQEFDAASEAGVDNVREAIVENVQYQPMMCRYKIFIIDEVHDLSGKAFDALLKTIEEPPPHVIFILATTEYNKVPPTIRSRCQKFEFHRGSLPDLVNRLQFVAGQEGVTIEPAAVNAIARMADGGYRDALTLLEQAILTTDGTITLNHVYDQLGLVSEEMVDGLLAALKNSDVPKVIELLNEVSRLGRDPRAILESMLYRLGDLTRAAYGIDIGGTGDAAQEAALHASAAQLGREFLLNVRASLSEAHKVIRDISLPRLWLESELIRMATLPEGGGQRADAGRPSEERGPVAEKKVAANNERRPATETAVRSTEVEETKPRTAGVQPEVAIVHDPVVDETAKAWVEAVQELSAVSKLMAAKLAGARAVKHEGTKVVIEFAHLVSLDWVKETPKRMAAVVDALKKRLGEEWTVELSANGRPSQSAESQAVELSLEGQKLADTVREIFGINDKDTQ